MFALLVPSLIGALAAGMATFAGRALLALGVGFVTYKGINLSIASLQSMAMSGVRGLPADALGLLSYLWLDKALSVIFSAVVTSLAMKAAGGAVKKMVLK